MIDKQSVTAAIRQFEFKPSPHRPRLLFDADEVDELRRRAAARPGTLDRFRRRADALLRIDPSETKPLEQYLTGGELAEMADAYVLLGDPKYAAWAKTRITATLGMETWFCHVHKGSCRVCDHVMANVAAAVAVAHDYLGDAISPGESDVIVEGMRRMHFEPYLDGTNPDNPEWWCRENMPSNWKIMTCGDSGLALCEFIDRWPHAREALARSVKAVIEVLGNVPPEGDWCEGINYWFPMLWMGLRTAKALRRLTGGQIDLFQHPTLRVTGDFAAKLITPGGYAYNFNDNIAVPEERTIEALTMLGSETRRGDWLYQARRFPAPSANSIACDDPRVEAVAPAPGVTCFPTTGVVTMITGWGPRDTFVGFKCGMSDVGHAHLDAGSFVVESAGKPLLIEHPYWPQGHYLGFFDMRGPRWNFDGPGTVGHTTLLVDGQGQTWGGEYPGRIVSSQDRGDYAIAVGDASKTYPGLLKKFIRTVLLIKPDVLIVRDVIVGDGPRHMEWLMHYAGDIRTRGVASTIDNEGVHLTVMPFLPDRSMGWRWNDVTRTSLYVHSDSLKEVTAAVRYRSFSPFPAAEGMEFLFGMRVNGQESGDDWTFEPAAGPWQLTPAGKGRTVVPDGDSLAVQ